MSTTDRLAPILDVLDLLRPGCTAEITLEAVAEARRAVMELAAALAEVARLRRVVEAANEDARGLAEAVDQARTALDRVKRCGTRPSSKQCKDAPDGYTDYWQAEYLDAPIARAEVALAAHRARGGGQ